MPNAFKYQGSLDWEYEPTTNDPRPHLRATLYFPWDFHLTDREWFPEDCELVETDEDGIQTSTPLTLNDFLDLVSQHKLEARIIEEILEKAE